MRILFFIFFLVSLNGCAVVTVADAAVSIVATGVKTGVDVVAGTVETAVDVITPSKKK